MKSYEKNLNTLKKILIIVFAVILSLILCLGFLMLSSRGYFADKGKSVPNDDILYLCAKFQEAEDSICANQRKIYPMDFYPLILKRFELTSSNHQDVENILGVFKISQGSLEFYPVEYYDLNRDGVWDVLISFEGTRHDDAIEFIRFREDLGF